MPSDACKECYAHGAIEQKIDDTRDDVKCVTAAIDNQRKFILATLVTSLMTMITIAFGLLVLYLQKPQDHRRVNYGGTETHYHAQSEGSVGITGDIRTPNAPKTN